jgi:hypothetical protein
MLWTLSGFKLQRFLPRVVGNGSRSLPRGGLSLPRDFTYTLRPPLLLFYLLLLSTNTPFPAKMRAFATVLFAVSSAFAYQVTSPGNNQGWTSTGPNTLEWVRVATDPLNFTAVLTNTVSVLQDILPNHLTV